MFKTMFKKVTIVALLVAGFTTVSATEADAWVVRRRFRPVRTAARVVLPPYRRRVVLAPVVPRRVFRPVVRPVVYAAPPVYAAPVMYGPRVRVGVGVGGYYGW